MERYSNVEKPICFDPRCVCKTQNNFGIEHTSGGATQPFHVEDSLDQDRLDQNLAPRIQILRGPAREANEFLLLVQKKLRRAIIQQQGKDTSGMTDDDIREEHKKARRISFMAELEDHRG